jgi:hypothetical protein
MEYVDYKGFMLKTWERDKKSHQDRIKAILNSPSHRIDNKPSYFTLNAPCKTKQRQSPDNKYETNHYYNSIRQITEKNVSRPLRQEIARMQSLGYIPKNFKPKTNEREVDDENWRIYQKLSKVKSCFSKKKWDSEFKSARAYRKLIAKPHLEKKLPKIDDPVSGRTLIDSYSVASFNF